MARLPGFVKVSQPGNPAGRLSRAPVRPSTCLSIRPLCSGSPVGVREAEARQTRHCPGEPSTGEQQATSVTRWLLRGLSSGSPCGT